MKTPLVSVIIVTWNRKEDVLETVQSVHNQAFRNYEIVVVDNGSTDGTVEALQQAYPEVRVVALDRNTGPTGGRNVGVIHARGEIFFFLDSDASLERQTLVHMMRKFESEPDVGVIACKVVNAATKQFDDTAGWIFSEKVKAVQDAEFFSFSFSECGSAVRKQAFDQAGPFWEFLFFGREGEELSLRIWEAGYKILYYPEAVVYHRVSPEKRVASGEREYFDLRNSLYIYFAHYPWWMLVSVVPLKVGLSLLRSVRRGYLRFAVRALFDVLRTLPHVWKYRKPMRHETARHYMNLLREHGPLSWDLRSWLKYKV